LKIGKKLAGESNFSIISKAGKGREKSEKG